MAVSPAAGRTFSLATWRKGLDGPTAGPGTLHAWSSVAPLLGKFDTLIGDQPGTPPLNQVWPLILLYVGTARATKPPITTTKATTPAATMSPMRDFFAGCGGAGA